MNNLPTHRSVLHGRTWGRTWSASEFDPITRYHYWVQDMAVSDD